MKLLSLRSYAFAAVAAVGLAAQGEVKVVRVVPNAEAPENPDGASWETAYGDIKTAYESLGADGGEVWIKKGLHILSNAVEMAANIGVYGGFAGTETSRDAADPKNNMTLITGDWELNDQHRTKNQRGWRNAGCSKMWDYSTLTFNEPIPSYTYSATDNDYYFHTPWPDADFDGFGTWTKQADFDAKKVKDTLCAFRHAADAADFGVAHFEGLVFSGFKKNVIVVEGVADPTQPDANKVEIRNCRFLGCCNGLFGASGGGVYGPVRVINARMSVVDSEFNRCLNGVTWNAAQLASDDLCCIVSNCVFKYVTLANKSPLTISCEGHATPVKSPRILAADCIFTHNYPLSVEYANAAAGASLFANGRMERCTFAENRITTTTLGVLCIYGRANMSGGPKLELCDCSFVSNWVEKASAAVYGTGCCIVTQASEGLNANNGNGHYLVVRNCYFADNLLKFTGGGSNGIFGGTCFYAYAQGAGGNKGSGLCFINCTAENNAAITLATHGKDTSRLGNFCGEGVYANCVMTGTVLSNGTTKAISMGEILPGTVGTAPSLINTVVKNDDANGTFSPGSFSRYYNSYCTKHKCGEDKDGNPIYDDLSGIKLRKVITAAGVPSLRVDSAPERRLGRPVWDFGAALAVWDPEYDGTRPWRLFHDARDGFGTVTTSSGNNGRTIKAMFGVDLSNRESQESLDHLLLDADEKVRYRAKKSSVVMCEALGPLCAMREGLVIMFQ